MAFNPISCEDIAKIINSRFSGVNNLITDVARIENAGEGDITFYSDFKYKKFFENSEASCIIVPDNPELMPLPGKALIYSDNPYRRFCDFLEYLENQKKIDYGFIHPTLVKGENTIIDETAFIGPHCSIGENCRIGKKVVLQSNIAIGDNAVIEEGTVVHPNVTICSYTIIGRNCLILPGAVIGSRGFGFIENQDGTYDEIPQLGNVVIGDNVEIGANTTIDRALIGSTVIEDGVKLDNLVHIAHNVQIGEHTAMAAMTGISGSTKVGKRNRFGGQVGLSGHIETTDDVILAAQSGINNSIKEKGIYFGSPARDKSKAFRIQAVIHQLPEFYRDFISLKNLVLEKLGIKE